MMNRERIFAKKPVAQKQSRQAIQSNIQLQSVDDLAAKNTSHAPITPSNIMHLQRTVGNHAVRQLLADRSPAQSSDKMPVQRFQMSQFKTGAKISDDGSFIFVGSKEIYATPASLKAANEKLAAVGALVKLQSIDDTTYNFHSADYVRVGPILNATAIKGPLWTRLNTKQVVDQGYRSFADCFRTSATVSGINPGVHGQKEKLILKTGDVPLLSVAEVREKKMGLDTVAARAATSFFLYAFPEFLKVLNAQEPVPDTQTAIVSALEAYNKLSEGPTKALRGSMIYKLILAQPQAKKLLMSTFGINEDIAPAIGTSLTQINDEAERAEEDNKPVGEKQDKWNFHWAGVILNGNGGKDYISLENCAVELSDATDAEMLLNSDAFNEGAPLDGEGAITDETKRARRGVKKQSFTKQDLINERWYFKLYGSGDQSFHEQSLKDPHATPSAVTLNIGKG